MVTFDEKNRYKIARQAMVKQHLAGRDISDSRVLEAMGKIPREAFVPEKYASHSYNDNPLPIGMGQTISQPYMVAFMTQCLKLTGGEEVLEIGTGSGYQTAILAELVRKVYTIERFNELGESAQAVLSNLGYENIDYCIGDGSCGWPKEKQFDRIIITASVPEIPTPLSKQLKEGGLLAAPVGGPWAQDLIIAEKKNGHLEQTTHCGCRFVKLIGKHGFKE